MSKDIILATELPRVEIISNHNHEKIIQEINELLKLKKAPVNLEIIPARTKKALKYAYERSNQKITFSVDDIFQIDKRLGGSGNVREAAEAFYDDNRVGVGKYSAPPESKYLKLLLEKYVKKYSVVDKPNIILAEICAAYFIFELIHPFLDRNGRTGRILCSWLMISNEYYHAAPYLEKEWGENSSHREVFDELGLSSYIACLNHQHDLNVFMNERFYIYFLNQLEGILKRIASAEKLI